MLLNAAFKTFTKPLGVSFPRMRKTISAWFEKCTEIRMRPGVGFPMIF